MILANDNDIIERNTDDTYYQSFSQFESDLTNSLIQQSFRMA